jgi:DNA-binding response OmpR family regulator
VGVRLLVVDDDVHVQRLLKRSGEAAGYEVVQAFDGATGLVLALAGNFDLVLLDVSMPKLDGRDVLSHLKQNPSTAGVPVILFSGGGEQHARRIAYELGAEDYIDKPFTEDLLMTKIGRVIEKVRDSKPRS